MIIQNIMTGAFGTWGPPIRIEDDLDPKSDSVMGLFFIAYFEKLVPGGFPKKMLTDPRLTAHCDFLAPIRKGQEAHARARKLDASVWECEVAPIDTDAVAIRILARPKGN